MHTRQKRLQWGLGAFSMALYILSLFLPALLFEDREALFGHDVLMWGWWGAIMFEFAWFANPAYFIAAITYQRANNRLTKVGSVIAIILGLTSFHAKSWWFNEGYGTPITGFGVGYYVWMSSFILLLLGCFVPSVFSSRHTTDPSPHHDTSIG